MRRNSTFVKSIANILATIALSLGITTTNSACFAIFHQPKVPEAMNAYKK